MAFAKYFPCLSRPVEQAAWKWQSKHTQGGVGQARRAARCRARHGAMLFCVALIVTVLSPLSRAQESNDGKTPGTRANQDGGTSNAELAAGAPTKTAAPPSAADAPSSSESEHLTPAGSSSLYGLRSRRALRRAGQRLTKSRNKEQKAELHDIFRALDADGDGQLTFEDIERGLEGSQSVTLPEDLRKFFNYIINPDKEQPETISPGTSPVKRPWRPFYGTGGLLQRGVRQVFSPAFKFALAHTVFAKRSYVWVRDNLLPDHMVMALLDIEGACVCISGACVVSWCASALHGFTVVCADIARFCVHVCFCYVHMSRELERSFSPSHHPLPSSPPSLHHSLPPLHPQV